MGGDQLRIAVFSDSALPVLNGVSVSIDALVGELRRQGHSVTVFAPRFPGHKDPDPNTFRCRSLETPLAKGYPIAVPPFYRMLQRFRKHQFDVVHTHTPFLMGMVGYRWAESHDLPIVSTYHTLYDRYAHYFRLMPKRYVRFRIAKHTNFYYNQMNHVITPSEASLKWLRRHSVSTPATVIPTGIPGTGGVARWEARQRLGVPPEAHLLLYVGRLAREKNLGMLLQGAALAMQEDPLLRLWLVGDGPYRAECTAMARDLGIGDKVRFAGFVDRSAVSEFYAAADLFVFASITETQGLVIQEAMMHGLPAVVVSGGGAGLAIEHGENGILTRNDPLGIAEGIAAILSDDATHARMSDAARRAVRDQGVPEMASRVLGVYRKVIIAHRDQSQTERFAWI